MGDTQVIPQTPSVQRITGMLRRAGADNVHEVRAREGLLNRIACEQPAVYTQGNLAYSRRPKA